MTEDYIDRANKWFEKHLPQLLRKHKGKWIVIFENELIGVYDTFSEAYHHGIEEIGSEQIFVRQVKKKDDKPMELSVNITLGLINADPTIQ